VTADIWSAKRNAEKVIRQQERCTAAATTAHPACAFASMPASSAPCCWRRPRQRPHDGDPSYVLPVHLDDRL